MRCTALCAKKVGSHRSKKTTTGLHTTKRKEDRALMLSRSEEKQPLGFSIETVSEYIKSNGKDRGTAASYLYETRKFEIVTGNRVNERDQ